jgi:hypothetical protein
LPIAQVLDLVDGERTARNLRRALGNCGQAGQAAEDSKRNRVLHGVRPLQRGWFERCVIAPDRTHGGGRILSMANVLVNGENDYKSNPLLGRSLGGDFTNQICDCKGVFDGMKMG